MSVSSQCPLLFKFLNACTVPCLRNVTLAVCGFPAKGNKQAIVASLVTLVVDGGDYAEILGSFTVKELRAFLQGGGSTRESVVAAFGIRDKSLAEQSDREATLQTSCQLVLDTTAPRLKLRHRLHKVWRKLGKKIGKKHKKARRKKLSSEIMAAVMHAAKDVSKTIGELLQLTKEDLGFKLRRHRRAFFDKCVQKLLPVSKIRKQKKRRLTFVCVDTAAGDPVQECYERRRMQLEDYNSEACLR
jgi:hypothetical protein